MLRKLLLSTVAASAMIGSAVAADLPSRRAPPPVAYAPPPVPLFTWTGLYVGVNAGGAFRASNGNNAAVFAFGGAAPFFLANNNNNGSNARFIGGGQVGYNWQINQIVLGVETDFQGLTRSNDNFQGAFGNNGGGWGYLGTARGRIGWAFDRFLVYGTGGLAYGNTNVTNTILGVNAFGAPALFTNNLGGNRTRLGYALGGGVEYAFTNNWSVKGEYLFTDLGRDNVTFIDPVTGGGFTFNRRERNHIVRAGLNYKFGWTPASVVARY
ncbi:MAG: porin family protein [Beijerinckiaceae bacterium]